MKHRSVLWSSAARGDCAGRGVSDGLGKNAMKVLTRFICLGRRRLSATESKLLQIIPQLGTASLNGSNIEEEIVRN
jgi:hypothetical protein